MKTKHKFPIGTKFTPRGRNQKEYTVIDRLTTTNEAGEVVALRYVTTHSFSGQPVTSNHITETTIAIALANA